MRKLLILLVSIASLTLYLPAKAQLILSDTAGLSLAKKLDSIAVASSKLTDLLAKEKVIRDLPILVLSNTADVSTRQDILFAHLAAEYAKKGDKVNLDRIFNEVIDQSRRRTVTLEVIKSFSALEDADYAFHLTKDSLEQICHPEKLVEIEDRYYMVNLLKHYLQQKQGNDADLEKYLGHLYTASGEYFDTDISERFRSAELAPEQQLFWQYAALLNKKGQITQVGNILETAVRNGSLPTTMLTTVCKDFDPSGKLYKKVTAQQKKSAALFIKNLTQLYQKQDPVEKEWDTKELKGKYVLLDFWGSWCLVCRVSHMDLTKLYDKYKDKGFEIVGVGHEFPKDLDKAKDLWVKAIEKDEITWLNVLNNINLEKFDALKAFQIGLFPTKILIDPNGREIARFYSGKKEDLEIKMKSIFGF
ncbi:Thiol-disulfide isomerase or thioredoxin [Sphingobacterium nematocida]|uniref:Thiol-disulfide isomerase or thioredoxin n=1 Tax=Sphingobacterium nematocida TaxID=1513896 RepID=A0A1T5AUT5_9SPHI|nr:TlpA disulfide reductase family protein [Sphingobacterium nematocida]SKB38569.1 Thiol-disulfide isomerase or thioredoxin [Sphingobacterium nematocida]